MYENLRKLSDVDVKNKTVVVRANFDVPMKDGEVLDDTRIKASAKTIEHLINNNCKVVIIAHLGRPNGEEQDELSLMPIRFVLGHILSKPIKFAHIHSCENSIKFMEQGEILLLENLRFSKAEESKDKKEREEYVKVLADLCDVYVNDAFSVYRKHASVYDLPQMMNSVAGFSVESEIEALNHLIDKPQNPYIAVVGGAKVDTKVGILKDVVSKVDKLLLGGLIAYAFLAANGVEIGKSKISKDDIKAAKEVIKAAKKENCEIILPVDHICGEEFEENTKPQKVETQQIPKNLMGLDIGPKTIAMYREILEDAKTIFWNGPMGVFEWENFNLGTEAIGEYIALSASRDAYKVAGGSETTYAMQLLKIKPRRFNHVSVGGGMMLEYLGQNKFEVLDILTEKGK